jgi:alpha-D-ribose 1-methylphosphonate 5-triphosphate synthase subunit PhnH
LSFHTGCRLTEAPQHADFALIWDIATALPLTQFNWGSPEYPEASTSLLVQCFDASDEPPVDLQGPGIRATIRVALPLPTEFWQQ